MAEIHHPLKDSHPRLYEAVMALGATHAERQEALGLSERRYFSLLAGEVPEQRLRPWLKYESVVTALRAEIQLSAA